MYLVLVCLLSCQRLVGEINEVECGMADDPAHNCRMPFCQFNNMDEAETKLLHPADVCQFVSSCVGENGFLKMAME